MWIALRCQIESTQVSDGLQRIPGNSTIIRGFQMCLGSHSSLCFQLNMLIIGSNQELSNSQNQTKTSQRKTRKTSNALFLSSSGAPTSFTSSIFVVKFSAIAIISLAEFSSNFLSRSGFLTLMSTWDCNRSRPS